MKKFTLLLALCSFLAAHSQSDPSWATKKELGFNLNARADAGMIAIGNDLYILGGYNGCGPKELVKYNTQTAQVTHLQKLGFGCANSINNGVLFTLGTKIYSFPSGVYDITTNQWTNTPSLSLPGFDPDTGFKIDNIIYITSKVGNNFYAFDPATNTLAQKANYPGNSNRRGAMSFEIAGKGYLIGGRTAFTNPCSTETGCYTDNVYEYNPVADTWTTKTGLPKAIVFGSAISHNGKGYAGLGEIYGGFGLGSVKTTSWYEYNPVSDTWVSLQNYMNLSSNDLVNSVAETTITKINEEIYIFGGRGVFDNYKDDITKYNTTTNVWSIVNADPGKNRTEAAGFYSNGKIYVGGGEDSEDLTDFWEYTIATNSWLQRENLPTSHTQRASVELNGKGYFVGGYDGLVSLGIPNYISTLLEYDPLTNVFTQKASLPFAKSGMVAMVYDGMLYAGFGRGTSGSPTATLNMYNPQTNTWSTKASAPFAGNNLSSFVIGNFGYIITFNPAPLIGKYNFLTDTWSTLTLALNNFASAEFSNQAFVFNNEAYFVHGVSTTEDRISKFNTSINTWSHVTNVPFKAQGNSIISTPSGVYFAFGDRYTDGGKTNSNNTLRFGAAVSSATGLFITNKALITTQISCGTDNLTNGARHAINDEDGDLFIAVEALQSATINACMEVSSTSLTIPFQTDAANYGNGFNENAMFLNKNLLLNNNNLIGQGGIVRLYFTQIELQKLVTDFNVTYGLTKTIADVKIVGYFENVSNSDHNIANNNANAYSMLPATLNNYGNDYYFEINGGVSTVIGEIRAALLTGQNLGVENPTIAKITIYPNPTNSILNIQTDQPIQGLKIVDIAGRTTSVKIATNNTVDVSGLSTGVYFIQVKTDDGFFREKFIKN